MVGDGSVGVWGLKSSLLEVSIYDHGHQLSDSLFSLLPPSLGITWYLPVGAKGLARTRGIWATWLSLLPV